MTYTSGRSPALSGNTLFHACNNVWENNNGHALEGNQNGRGLFEGNTFINVPNVVNDYNWASGELFGAPDGTDLSVCQQYIGRSCVSNAFENSGPFDYADTGFLADFNGFPVADCGSASDARNSVPSSAGNTL